MIVVKFFSDFCTSEQCIQEFSSLSRFLNLNFEDKIRFTTQEDYTHVVILNRATPSLEKIPKKNVLGLACEPVQFLNLYNGFIDYAKEKIGIYYIGEKGNLPEPFVEHHGFMYFQYNAVIKEIPLKTKLMSIIF